MTGPTITYRTSFRRKPESRLVAPPSPPPAPVAQPNAPTAAAPTATPIARMLALAHHVERLVEAGELKDYAEAAQRLGMCKSHVTHMMALLQLAPDIQEAILDGRLDTTERVVRPICRLLPWNEQRAIIAASTP